MCFQSGMFLVKNLTIYNSFSEINRVCTVLSRIELRGGWTVVKVTWHNLPGHGQD